jgi:CRISPR-associated protein Cas1
MMWVQGEFKENEYTEDGSYRHRRVDEKDGAMPRPEELDPDRPAVARSVWLSAPAAGLTAKIDLVEIEDGSVIPVEYKRSARPDIYEGAWENDRVQLCAQGIILKENGFLCNEGIIYFAGSRSRVKIEFSDRLVKRTFDRLSLFKKTAKSGQIPPPLDHSSKCIGCSLAGICLPDELIELKPYTDDKNRQNDVRKEPRQLLPALDDALPVYVQEQGAVISKKGDEIFIKKGGKKVASARLFETSQVNLLGNIQISTQTVQELCRRGIPVIYFSYGGWFYGMTTGPVHKNIELRIHQYRCASNFEESLVIARRFISSKILNSRTLLRRNGTNVNREVLRQLRESAIDAEMALDFQELLGIEGNAARVYFQSFNKMIKNKDAAGVFDFNGRNRRPPSDPVNALLSFAYSLLTKDIVVALSSAGFDPYLGFFHKPRYGRPSLALDLMEEFRPVIADSVAITAINTKVIKPDDFTGRGLGVALKSNARRAFILAYERRMDQLFKHPVFGYQISYRRILEVQARLLGRFLAGEIDEYPVFLIR